MDRIIAAKVLLKTVERGSASAAAEELGMSRAMASRYIAAMEDWSGTRLLHRTTRQLSLTSAGERVLEMCREIVRVADAVTEVADHAETPHGLLRVTAPSILAEAQLIPLLSDFADVYPRIKVDLQISDRTIDLVQDRIDLAIRIANRLDPSLIAKRLGQCSSLLYASPRYLQEYGVPSTPEDLDDHRCLTYTHLGGTEWSLKSFESQIVMSVDGTFQTNDAVALRRAALSGLGIAMLPRFAADQEVRTGQLVVVLPEWKPSTLGIHALYVSRKHLPMAARVLIDFLATRLADI
ncbi:LysR family transcriptional regulator [Rhizobium sp. MC63]|uniref:LysR family transcriptional regulator n=1 Tax=Rhizobium mulingense TaxID=3031128 RepID=A0ACC6N3X9_9HYPH|nr:MULTISPECIES: LysR family transcriptional regulator [unclassified Rhizobium]MDF0698708.1 LysR family transcriptional regulator [Rhizobium sp. MC63]MEA3520304.1 LysR family transcriptional regulator [Rhizobium sp. MJ31]